MAHPEQQIYTTSPNSRTVQQKISRAWQQKSAPAKQKSAPAKQKSAPAKGEQQLESKLTLLYPQLYQTRALSEKQISTRLEGFDASDMLGGVCTGRKCIRAPKGRVWDAQEVPRPRTFAVRGTTSRKICTNKISDAQPKQGLSLDFSASISLLVLILMITLVGIVMMARMV